VRSDLLRAAGWRAARHGLAGRLVHPVTWELVPAGEAVRALVDRVAPALAESGDTDLVADGLGRLSATGNGARRQRAAFERTGDLRGVVADLVERTSDSVG
jgi:carboxylate-amine ligase